MSRTDGADEFEAWLEQELRAVVQSVPGSRPHAAQAAYRSVRAPKRGGRLRAVAGRGLAAGIATAVLLGAGAIGVAATATGSVDPVSWGHAVVRVVEGCRQPACGPVPAPDVRTPGPGGAPATPGPGAATGQRTERRPSPTEDSPPAGSGEAQHRQGSWQDEGPGKSASAPRQTKEAQATPSPQPTQAKPSPRPTEPGTR